MNKGLKVGTHGAQAGGVFTRAPRVRAKRDQKVPSKAVKSTLADFQDVVNTGGF